ncbi:MAG: spore germination protein GerW family protein [Candidatus Cloacimonadaceae bacterium]|jgi:uncharacterized spore protein YtfJ|nr:hypothetical protein [Candidatus Cloacimonadota bacterium]MDY0127923.1 spore germination protein GerW family protein [Candidatus Cloacimonadaceae bacterium]MCB5255286.1 hypothetical protein [Candidatus Cloacimonadota bacterium]MCK9177996.1 hypothetical protein [Candidatus Cloacimonadota bacterium]MCK9242936.1 hypothetical protein [Candidatus Cloacimonadota bacterium]
MKLDAIFSQIREVLKTGAGVKFSFGDPVSVGDLSIIPVARVGFGFGGGGGSSSGSKKKKQKKSGEDQEQTKPEADLDFGGGGGGGMKTDPVGIYAIKADRIRYYPIITIREIVGISGFIILLLFRIGRLRRKAK